MPATTKRIIVTWHALWRWRQRVSGDFADTHEAVRRAFCPAELTIGVPSDCGDYVRDLPGHRYYRADGVIFVTRETDRDITIITVIDKRPDPPAPAVPVRKAAIRKAKLRAAKEAR